MTERYTRKQLLREPIKRILDARSEQAQTPEEIARDFIVEKGGEGAALLAVLALANKGSKDRLVYYDINAETKLIDTPEYPDQENSIGILHEITSSVSRAAADADEAWYEAYRESRTVVTLETECDSDGNCSVVPKTDTEYYWDEPSELTSRGLDNTSLGTWRSFFQRINNRSGDLKDNFGNSFNLDRGAAKIFYKERIADTGTQQKVALASYFTVGALHSTYEEVLEQLDNRQPYVTTPTVEEKYMKRRTFLKLATTSLAAWQIRRLQNAFASENDNLLDDIQANTDRVVSEMDVDSKEGFRRFIGSSPLQIRQQLVEINDTLNRVFDSGYDGGMFFDQSEWNSVQPYLDNLHQISRSALERLDELFNIDPETNDFDVPREITIPIKYLDATRKITSFVNNQRRELNIRHIYNALGLAGIYALSAAISEGVVLPLSDKALEEVEEILDKDSDDIEQF